jgi:cytochrome c-type biogenesis protein CcmH/NrfG
MKKRLALIFTLTVLAWLVAAGCSNNNIDTAKVRAAFASLSGGPKDDLDLALKAIEQSNYVAAIRPLKVLAISVKMDKNQTLLLEDTLAKVEAKAAQKK